MSNSFNKGMLDASARVQKQIKIEIMAALGITSRTAFAMRRHGKVKHTPAEIAAIEEVFKRHQIIEPWGEK